MEDVLNQMPSRIKDFVYAYLLSKNATRAAIEVGYSAKTAGQIGHRLLKRVDVQKYLAFRSEMSEKELHENKSPEHEDSTQKILDKLEKFVFMDVDLKPGDPDFYQKKVLFELQLKTISEIAKIKGMYKTKQNEEDSCKPDAEYHSIVEYIKSVKKMSIEEQNKEKEKWDRLNTLPQCNY